MTRKRPFDSSSWTVQLDLWNALEVAEDIPEEADLEEIWTSLEVALAPLEMRAQLKLAGDAIARIAQLIQDRAWLTIQETHQLDQSEGPVISAEQSERSHQPARFQLSAHL